MNSMFDDLELIHMSVRILRFLSLIYEHTWRRYVCLSMTSFLVFTQLYYMFCTSEGIDSNNKELLHVGFMVQYYTSSVPIAIRS